MTTTLICIGLIISVPISWWIWREVVKLYNKIKAWFITIQI